MPIIWNTGLGQQTLAVQTAYRALMGGSRAKTGTRRRKKKAAAPKRRKSKVKKAAGKLKRLVKGSKAAKAYMAKIRRKRKG